MFWAFLLLSLLFVFGGLLNTRPSATQKRIANLRSNAFGYGLHVKLPVSLSFPALCLKSEHAYYCKQCKLKPDQIFIHLLRDSNSTIQTVPAKKTGQIRLLENILTDLPAEYCAIYIGNGFIGISWDEVGDETVPEELVNALIKIENLLFD